MYRSVFLHLIIPITGHEGGMSHAFSVIISCGFVSVGVCDRI